MQFWVRSSCHAGALFLNYLLSEIVLSMFSLRKVKINNGHEGNILTPSILSV
jgi:hypothetical protein